MHNTRTWKSSAFAETSDDWFYDQMWHEKFLVYDNYRAARSFSFTEQWADRSRRKLFLWQSVLLVGRILLNQYSKLRLRNDPPELIFTVAADQKDLCIATRDADHCHRFCVPTTGREPSRSLTLILS